MRATIVWRGVVGSLLYTYAGAGFAYRFNSLCLIYVALFSLADRHGRDGVSTDLAVL